MYLCFGLSIFHSKFKYLVIPSAVVTTLRSCYKFSRSLTNKSFQYNFFFLFVQTVSTYQAGYKNGTKKSNSWKPSLTVPERPCKFMYVFLSIYLPIWYQGLWETIIFFWKFWKMILIQNKWKLVILPSLEKLEFAQNDPKIGFSNILGKLCCYFFFGFSL